LTTIFRMNLKSEYNKEIFERKDLIDFCKNEEIIGVGWIEVTTTENSDDSIKKQLSEHYNKSDASRGYTALKALKKMNINDLVWTRYDNIYYLCRVTQKWIDRTPTEKHDSFDISNYIGCEWIEIGEEWIVPGKVINSFVVPRTVQKVNEVENISKKLWNKKSPKNSYKYDIKEKDHYWNLLSSEMVEEIVILYLQIKKNYFVHTSTVKKNTPNIECVLVNLDGDKAYPQVKSGFSQSLDAKFFYDRFCINKIFKVYLFTISENYINDKYDNVECIKKIDIENFITQYEHVLPERTRYWIEISNSQKN
jgi:hypothetical protein